MIDRLTSGKHHNDRENHLVVGVRRNVAKAHGHEGGKDKVQGGRVPVL